MLKTLVFTGVILLRVHQETLDSQMSLFLKLYFSLGARRISLLCNEGRETNVLKIHNLVTDTAEKSWDWESGGWGACSSRVTIQLVLKLIRRALK